MARFSKTRLKEIALVRIKRLASSGLPLEPFVRTLSELLNDAVPHSEHRVLHPFFNAGNVPGVLNVGGTPEVTASMAAHQHYFIANATSKGASKFPSNTHTLDQVLPRKNIWRVEDIAISPSNFYRSEGFNEVYRPLGYHYLIWVVFNEEGRTLAGYPLWRGPNERPFSDGDQAFLQAVVPHLVHGFAIAQKITAEPSPRSDFLASAVWGTGVVLMDAAGKVVGMDREAQNIFAEAAAYDGIFRSLIYERIKEGLDYVRRSISFVFDGDQPSVRAPVVQFSTHRSGIVLKMRGALICDADGHEYVTVLLERGEASRQRQERFEARWGLSHREAGVLALVAQGKTNLEIGTILDLSPLTVKKHLEHILRTLNVETRTAAAALFLEQRSE